MALYPASAGSTVELMTLQVETRGERESARMAGEKKGFFARTARERGGTRARALGATSH